MYFQGGNFFLINFSSLDSLVRSHLKIIDFSQFLNENQCFLRAHGVLVGAISGVLGWPGRYFEGLGVPLGALGGQSAPKRPSPDPHGSILVSI